MAIILSIIHLSRPDPSFYSKRCIKHLNVIPSFFCTVCNQVQPLLRLLRLNEQHDSNRMMSCARWHPVKDARCPPFSPLPAQAIQQRGMPKEICFEKDPETTTGHAHIKGQNLISLSRINVYLRKNLHYQGVIKQCLQPHDGNRD